MRVLLALLLAAGAAWASPPVRFFVMGSGRLALSNAHTGEHVDVRYRRPDGSYDADAITRIRRAFRSTGDKGEGKVSLRLVELVSHMQRSSGVKALTLMSGYRRPDYNEGLRAKGIRAAGGSLHTEGLAADVAFPHAKLRDLWMKLRALDCCGAGYYQKDGFLHIDVGRPRFWEPATSRVEENISAGNAKLFARTEFDRYAPGETILVTLHSMTVPPVRIAREARLGDHGTVRLAGEFAERDGCLEIPASGTTLRAEGSATGGGRLVLSTCEPRAERTPEGIETNVVEMR
jgi:uncharacterized protein YcbK (DUF882 family)